MRYLSKYRGNGKGPYMNGRERKIFRIESVVNRRHDDSLEQLKELPVTRLHEFILMSPCTQILCTSEQVFASTC